ncbi:hypothetical protein [Streptomyces sp. SM11]|uniref:hypothetical protein n=1 Tax=Streptomyces sp. SM11 TaxID=565557 RepID=UPI000CD59614|nr:hypothetical protein [Streptomyces sp. SM11]
MMGAAVLDPSPGAGVVLVEVQWLVERREPHLGYRALEADVTPALEFANSVGCTNQYFIDLHTVASLITLTWPAARNLALSDEHAEILEQDALDREERRSRRNGGGGKAHHFHALASPSADARAYVAATAIAHRILKGTDSGALIALAPVHAHL